MARPAAAGGVLVVLFDPVHWLNQLICPPCKAAESRAAGAQVRNAAEEYHAEFAAKEATIAALGAEAEAARARMQAEIEKLRSEMEARPP